MYYLFAIIDNIKSTLSLVSGMTGTIAVLSVLACCISYDCCTSDEFKKVYAVMIKTLKVSLVTCIVSITINTFIPTHKQLAFVIAAPYIVENKDVQEIGQNTLDIIKEGTEYLKESLKNSKQ